MTIADVTPGTDGRAPVDVLMAYLADMHTLEIWAWDRLMPPTPDAFGPVEARAAEIRAQHCTPRAQRVWAGPPLVANPPTNDPATTLVVELVQTSAKRVRITTREGGRPTMTNEYVVERSGGNWRLSSRAYPRDGPDPRTTVAL